MMCGEKDPFVDDVVIFSGLLKQAKREFGDQKDYINAMYQPEEIATTRIIAGMSHAFLNITQLVPEAVALVKVIGDWFIETETKENLREKEERAHYCLNHILKKKSKGALQEALSESESYSSFPRNLQNSSSNVFKGNQEGQEHKNVAPKTTTRDRLKKHSLRKDSSALQDFKDFVSGQAYHVDEKELVARRTRLLAESLVPLKDEKGGGTAKKRVSSKARLNDQQNDEGQRRHLHNYTPISEGPNIQIESLSTDSGSETSSSGSLRPGDLSKDGQLSHQNQPLKRSNGNVYMP
jgi:hypothetical protein